MSDDEPSAAVKLREKATKYERQAAHLDEFATRLWTLVEDARDFEQTHDLTDTADEHLDQAHAAAKARPTSSAKAHVVAEAQQQSQRALRRAPRNERAERNEDCAAEHVDVCNATTLAQYVAGDDKGQPATQVQGEGDVGEAHACAVRQEASARASLPGCRRLGAGEALA